MDTSDGYRNRSSRSVSDSVVDADGNNENHKSNKQLIHCGIVHPLIYNPSRYAAADAAAYHKA